VPAFLRGARALFDYRDFLGREDSQSPQIAIPSVAIEPGEAGALRLLAGWGLPVVATLTINSESELERFDADYPVALKTAVPGIAHKSDVGGVVLDIQTEDELRDAYRSMAARLGPEALLAPMAGEGVEMLLGCRQDPQFGPVVLIGCGGIHAETLNDVVVALPPFSVAHARRCVDRLRLRPMLDERRGKPRRDIEAFCDAAARFSVMVDALGNAFREIDINPILVHDSGCTIVDALVVP
jgi:hypothetical protein